MKKMLYNNTIPIHYGHNSTRECVVITTEKGVSLTPEEIRVIKRRIELLLPVDQRRPVVTESERDLIYYIYRAFRGNKHPYKTIDELFEALSTNISTNSSTNISTNSTSYYTSSYTLKKLRKLIEEEASYNQTTYETHVPYIINLYKSIIKNTTWPGYKPRMKTVPLYSDAYERVKKSATARGLTIQQELSRLVYSGTLASASIPHTTTTTTTTSHYPTDTSIKRRTSISLPDSAYRLIKDRAEQAGTNMSYEITKLIIGGD